ncbi:hypothetical protein CDL15_Pgr014682 [Punica granatum]|uniref:Uncharacterized protein n=1 Tax=Punica granatum TaxID=22663 RepID=A0A218XZZ5_PUNGR|nr:hypothetical protein CDL15_Pgr014682 [Punica granatum]
MPGNGVGDRVHNSFDQENLSQGQHHFKAVDKNWPGLSNNIWVGSQTQNGFPLISNLKNYSVPQSANIESGHGIPSYQAVNGLNSAQPNLRSEVAGSQFQNQQTALNGFMQGHAAARQYEANFLGMDVDSYQNNVTSKGLSILESHHGNGPDFQKKDFGRFPNVQPPVSVNAFGGQEQMGGQHPALLQSLQRQQSGIGDMQLLQQQMILRQLQDTQRQQLQQQGIWQQNAPINLLSTLANQSAANHSPALLNGIPVHDSSNKSWPELFANNPNRQQLSSSAVMQGSSSGFELSSEQNQALRTMGLVHQQCDQSLYGVPVPVSRDNLSQTSQIQSENPAGEQISSFGNAFSRNQHAAPSDHDTKDGPLVSRQVGSAAAYNSTGGFESSNLRQVLSSQRNVSVQEFPGKRELTGLSATAQEKSQNVATLDPAEEKILFGSDDNLWEAFGGEMNVGLGGLNMSEGSGSFGGIPSLQSGSWSALMQSALAETSSVETGQQEEWSGLSFRSTEPPTGHQQPSTFNSGGKQERQAIWDESNMRANSGFVGAPSHQLEHKASHERSENFRSDSSPRYMQDFSEGNKRLEPSMLSKSSTDGIRVGGKVDNSSNADKRQYSSGTWTHQQSMSSFDARAQLDDRANGWNRIDSRVPSEGATLKTHSSDMGLQPSQSGSHNRQAHEIHGSTAGRTDSFHGLGGTMLHRQDSSSNAAVNSSNSRGFQESTQWLQNNQSFNLWRQVDSSANSRGKGHHSDKGSKMLESPGNGDVHERQNSNKRENSSGSFPSNVSRHASPGLVQENACTDGSYSHSLHGSKENSSGRAVQRPAGFPKFQYHPMGDLDVDVDSSRGAKGGASPQVSIQQVFNKFSPVGGSGGSHSTNRSAQPSQNMLELLHKLDQSKEREAASHFSSSDRNDAHEAETSDGSVGQLQRNQSPVSQGFGLQLGPPSQRLQNPDRAFISQSSSQTPSSRISSGRSEVGHMPLASTPSNRSLSSWKETYEGENTNHISGASEQINDKSSMGFISGFPFSRSHLQNQRDAGRALPGQSINPALHRLASHSKVIENSSEGILPSQSALPSVPENSVNTSRGSNASIAEGAQTGIRAHTGHLPQHSLESEAASMSRPSLVPSVPQQSVFSGGLSTTLPGSTVSGLLKPPVPANDNDVQKGVGGVAELSASVSFKPPESSRTAEAAQSTLQGKVSSVNHVSDASLTHTVQNSIPHQNYSLLHQMQAMKNAEVDPSDRNSKRFMGPESGIDSQTAPLGGNQLSHVHSAAAGDASTLHPSLPGGETKTFNLSGKQGDNWDASPASLHLDAIRNSGISHSSSNYEAFLRREHSQAPTWVGQPGTLRNGQVLQVLDAQRMAAIKHMEQAQLVQKPADSLRVHEPANQFQADSDASPPVTTGYRWLPTSARTENISSQQSVPPEVTDQNLLRKQKKRKIPAPEVQAWHKEVMTSARLHSASTTEIEWARAANRLVQKMEDETETNEDGLPSLRPRKRLILTTQLMQQLLRPPPAPFLAGDARSHYENVTYCVSKLALGDACQAIHYSSHDPSMPNSSEKVLQEKPKVSKKSDNEDIAKAMEDLLGRTKKFENELLRLDQRSSMVDLRVELQDIERFSIINRFAKFHGRSQSDGSGAPSSDPMAYASRPVPQRYVIALPMPRNPPDRVQCLSL